MDLTTNPGPRFHWPPVTGSEIRRLLDGAVVRARAAAALLSRPAELDALRRRQVEDAVTHVLRLVRELQPLLDADGFLHNWLIDVVRQLRRGVPGAAGYEMEMVVKRLEALREEW